MITVVEWAPKPDSNYEGPYIACSLVVGSLDSGLVGVHAF